MEEKSSKNSNSAKSPLPSRNIHKTGLFWISHHIPLIILIFVLAVAAFIRIWAAEISSGPDVPQFWAFAKVFQTHGLDFYRYADAQLDIFPMKGWGFVYPPIWLLISRVALLFAPHSQLINVGGNLVADPAWRLAIKMPIIIADLAIGLLLYWGIPGSKRRKVLFAGLWLLHPTAWFESGVFGQFDAVAAAFLLTCVILLMKGKDRLAFVFAGLAIMTKQHTAVAVVLIVIVCARNMNFKRLLTNCYITAGVVAVISIPFLVTGNLIPYARSIFIAGSPPGYQDPLVFAFSGLGALLTFLHNTIFLDATGLISLTVPLLIIVFIITAIFSYKRWISPLQGALAGFLVFIAFYYRINYQYLIIYIPFALLLAASTKYKFERVFALVIAIVPAVWPWITNIPWWFTDTQPGYAWVPAMFKHIGLLQRYMPDWANVVYACVIMCTAIAYIILVFTKWSKHQEAIPVSISSQLKGKL